ncbi:MAG: hypothetical protein CMB99_09350 [Flavobacteriaceae bacterium]|nr:hypothetical protein [Flavobacteriaceae bacterium]|tara:strand:+ start:465923 stop:466834 length:912 start_codon:yes stop_codon:yes gene_type:complete
MQIKEFIDLGRHISINGHKVFVIDTDERNNKTKETFVIINGFPTLTYDFRTIIKELSAHYRVVIHDHFGFGLSELPDTYCFSLLEQADVCIKVWNHLRLKEFTILGDNYGTHVAKEILYRYNAKLLPFRINKLILTKNSRKINHLNLLNINKLLENPNLSKYREQLVEHHNKGLFDNFEMNQQRHDFQSQKVQRIWEKFNELQGQKEILVLSNFLEESYLYWHRWNRALKDSQIPVKIFWRRDDVGLKEIAIALASHQPKNVQFIENEKCFVIEENPTDWLKMVMKTVNKNFYNALKYKYQVI